VTQKLISFGKAWRARLRRPRALIAAAGAAVLVTGAVTTAVVVSSPSYPHAWCGPMLAQLHVRGRATRAMRLPWSACGAVTTRQWAPCCRTWATTPWHARWCSTGTMSRRPGSVAGMASTFTAVNGDLRALNRKCGHPPGAYAGDSF